MDKFELQGLDFQEKVRNGYLQLAKAEPERFLVVDALGDPAVVSAEITKQLEKLAVNNAALRQNDRDAYVGSYCWTRN